MANDILPGDILLHMGKSEISKVVAWAGNSRHSHVAIVLNDDPSTLIETTPKNGVVKSSLKDRLKNKQNFKLIEVYRFVPNLTPAWLDALMTTAKNYIGKPYAVNEVVWLGMICAFRNKVPVGFWERALVRLAIDLAIKSDTTGLTCSEFVYRCFEEAKTTPQNALRPTIVIQQHSNPPFPDVNWVDLWKEYKQAIKHSQYGLEAYDGTPPPEAKEPVSDQVLRDKAAELREKLRMQADLLAEPAMDATMGPMPNPKTVEPGDLAASPSFSFTHQVLP
jgi:hypothetical protein